MRYLLDSAPLAAYIRGRKGAVARLDARVPGLSVQLLTLAQLREL